MFVSVGIGFAFVAMLCWGVGDFLIQKETRKIGDWETLFLICFFGTVVLMPFGWRRLPSVFSLGINEILVLAGAVFIILIAALLEFESLKKGKIAIIEPIWSLEIISATFFAYYFLQEELSLIQIILIAILIVSLFLLSMKGKIFTLRFFVEKGVSLAIIGGLAMGAANFFIGWGSRIADPIVMNLLINIFAVAVTGVYILARGDFGKMIGDCYKERRVILPMVITDNTAWVAFAFAMTLAPIAIATALSESYIIIAVVLGLLVGREKIVFHQKVGLVTAFFAAIALAAITV